MSSSQADAWVRERRLRPIYELLDSGNNKKVIADVERLLKKQSQFSCAKVLKALALIRMNKADEARVILNPIIEEVPTDDGTIQALSICFRELDEPNTICSILEAACKKEQSEELLTHCFMAQVRTNEYQKQHFTALNLYKLYNKPTYFGWAIASLLVKAERSMEAPEEARRISLPLAERMLTKFIAEQKTAVEEHILTLYFGVLASLLKWEQLLIEMKTHGYPRETWCNDHFHNFHCLALRSQNKDNELFDYLKSTFMKNMDDYDLLKQIICQFAKNNEDWVDALMDDLRANYPSRVVALGDLYYCLEAKETSAKINQRIREDLAMAVQFGADKPSLFADVSAYLGNLTLTENKSEFIKALDPHHPVKCDSGDPSVLYDSVKKIIRDVNYEYVDRELFPDKDAIQRMERAHRCLEKYFQGELAMSKLRTDENMITKEPDYHDSFLVIAASSLIANYDDADISFDGLVKKVRQAKPHWATKVGFTSEQISDMKASVKEDKKNKEEQNTNEAVNGLGSLSIDEKENPEKPYVLRDEEYLLMTAIALMEFGIECSPYSHQLRILLSRVYCRIGAVQRACKVIQGLDLKHIQWDSLGYLILWQVSSNGMYPEAARLLTTAENMYTGYRRESMEHVITAYKYGTFNKIGEFMSFRDLLCNSVQFGRVLCEKRLLDFLTCATKADVRKLADHCWNTMESEPMFTKDDIFSDNRDFTVLQHMESDLALKYLKESTMSAEVNQFKTRKAMLSCIINMVLAAMYENVGDDLAVRQEQMKLAITQLTVTTTTLPTMVTIYENSPRIHGLWPPPAARHNQIGCLTALHNQMDSCYEIIVENKQSKLSSLSQNILDDSNKMMRWLREDLQNLSLLTVATAIEDIHHVLETLSVSRIILDTALTYVRQKSEQGKSGKKKKARNDADFKKEFGGYTKTLQDASKSLLEYIEEFKEEVKRLSHFKWEMAEKRWDGLIGVHLRYNVFPKCFDKVQQYIHDSHQYQLEEMRKVAVNLVDYVHNIVP